MGEYTRWDPFEPNKRKANVIGTLVHRALEICSLKKFSSEVDKIKNVLQQIEYPEEVIIFGIKKKIINFQIFKWFGPKKCLVYLKLPWIGDTVC